MNLKDFKMVLERITKVYGKDKINTLSVYEFKKLSLSLR